MITVLRIKNNGIQFFCMGATVLDKEMADTLQSVRQCGSAA